MKRVALLIDGGHSRVMLRKAGKSYNPEYIEKFALACVSSDEELIRILYYDCAPYKGTVRLPVTGDDKIFNGDPGWLNDLAAKDLFAVRLGILKFRGFVPKRIPIKPDTLTDDDFRPDFEQKGVDMRIGLDIATHADRSNFDRFIVVTADTDCVPAFKHARKTGMQIILIELPGARIAPELRHHVDYVRPIILP